MGAQASSPSSPKLTLAEKRYRVNGLRRKSTRKTGNVTTNGTNIEISKSVQSFDAIDGGLASTTVAENGSSLSNVRSRSGGEIDVRLLALYPQQFQKEQQTQAITFGRSSSASANGDMTNAILLTRTQRVLIENSWKRCRKTGSNSVGSRIFISVLTAQPDIKVLFGLEKIPQGRLKYDPNFRKHASVLTRTFDYVVKNLPYTDKLSQHFQALGKKHCHMQGRVFQDQYWDAFAEAATVVTVEGENGRRCRETASSWRCLIAFIIKQMRRGYDDEKNLRKRFSASLIGASSSSSRSVAGHGSGKAGKSTRHSIRHLSDFRVSSLSAIPTPPSMMGIGPQTGADGANRHSGCGTSLSLTTSRAPSLTLNRVRTPSMNSTASAFADLPQYYQQKTIIADNNPFESADDGSSNKKREKDLLLPNSLQQQQQHRSASWCSEQKPFEEQFSQQLKLTALAKAMRQQANATNMKYVGELYVVDSNEVTISTSKIKANNSDISNENMDADSNANGKNPNPENSNSKQLVNRYKNLPPPLISLESAMENGYAISTADASKNSGESSALNVRKGCVKFFLPHRDDEKFFTPPTSARYSASNSSNMNMSIPDKESPATIAENTLGNNPLRCLPTPPTQTSIFSPRYSTGGFPITYSSAPGSLVADGTTQLGVINQSNSNSRRASRTECQSDETRRKSTNLPTSDFEIVIAPRAIAPATRNLSAGDEICYGPDKRRPS